jgi:hypothetical protein
LTAARAATVRPPARRIDAEPRPPLRPHLAKAGRHAAGGFEPEGGPAGEDDSVDLLDGILREEQVGLAGCRRATHDVDRSDRRPFAEDDRHARLQTGIVGVADLQSGDVGEEVPHGVRLDPRRGKEKRPGRPKKIPGVAAGVLHSARRRRSGQAYCM